MSLLEELAACAPQVFGCLGPDCSNLVETDEPFCSSRCSDAFDAWAADMAAFDDDHETNWREL